MKVGVIERRLYTSLYVYIAEESTVEGFDHKWNTSIVERRYTRWVCTVRVAVLKRYWNRRYRRDCFVIRAIEKYEERKERKIRMYEQFAKEDFKFQVILCVCMSFHFLYCTCTCIKYTYRLFIQLFDKYLYIIWKRVIYNIYIYI